MFHRSHCWSIGTLVFGLIGCGGQIGDPAACPSGSFCFADVRGDTNLDGAFDGVADTTPEVIETDTLIGDTDILPDVLVDTTPPDPSVPCPDIPPTKDTSCSGHEPTFCSYPTACGGDFVGSCVSGIWEVRDPCALPCPTLLPVERTLCSSREFCSYPGGRCGPDLARCLGGSWHITATPCDCPAAMPLADGGCDFPVTFVCGYPNSCGGTSNFTCVRRRWNEVRSCSGAK